MDQLTVSSQPVALPPTGAGLGIIHRKAFPVWIQKLQHGTSSSPRLLHHIPLIMAGNHTIITNWCHRRRLRRFEQYLGVISIRSMIRWCIIWPAIWMQARRLSGRVPIQSRTELGIKNNGVIAHTPPVVPVNTIVNGQSRYQPWGATVPTALNSSTYNFSNPYNLSYKDPLVWGSDYWDFPTNRYPTVGWLGRVHRGTPWQDGLSEIRRCPSCHRHVCRHQIPGLPGQATTN